MKYMANDGKVFDKPEDCMAYEQKQKELKKKRAEDRKAVVAAYEEFLNKYYAYENNYKEDVSVVFSNLWV